MRKYSYSIHILGSRPFRSRQHWGKNVSLWRKREAYIALVRYLLGIRPDYNQWDCFIFGDYIMRQRLHKTFVSRHLPLSNGNDELNFQNKFKFPWGKYTSDVPRKVKHEGKVSVKSQKSVPCSDAPMIYDVELGCLIPLN